MAGTKRRSVRQAATRKRSVYVDPDTDEDDFEAAADDADDSADDSAGADEAAHPPPPKRRKLAPRTRHVTRSKSVGKSGKAGAKAGLKGVGRRRKWNTDTPLETPSKGFTGPTDGHVPAWTSLPLEILRDIFLYAAQPMHEQTRASASNVGWLMTKAARTCRAFAQPALEAYYLSPSLLTTEWPHRLLETLQRPKATRYMDYNVKTKALSIDVRRLAYTAHNKPRFDLCTLVAELPQLQHLEILHPVDEPPFRAVFKVQPWHYPPALFRTLQHHGQRLRSFRWNRSMIAADNADLYALLTQTHLSQPFEYLSRLTVCGFNYADSAEPPPPEDGTPILAPGLATSITLLPHLQDLTFTSCDILTDALLSALPLTLTRLEITSCLELTSPMLETYLSTSAPRLKTLVLNHNISLNLSFLPPLARLTPNLETLTLDLRSFSERLNSNDAEPLYTDLLTAAETPTWPATLRTLELTHIQRCSAAAARNLFRSLVDAAQSLPDLRRLVLHSHINIPWRDRAGFREQWIERLRRVYLRASASPSAQLNSSRLWRMHLQGQQQQQQSAARRGAMKPPAEVHDSADEEDSDDGAECGEGGAGFEGGCVEVSHIRVSPAKEHAGDTDVYSDSSPEKPRPRRSRRVAEASLASQASSPEAGDDPSDAADEEEGEDRHGDGDGDGSVGSTADDDGDWRHRPEAYVQGLCDVVDVRIDNQRPRENQFTAGDFLDSEVSGDEDWTEGGEGGEGGGGYAW
ncbi:hypothetical protein LTR08_009044 [Meristemomyces frigidus]|nr:hypothetical protein LTR08_009044 [Meristemomyces frigidus]